jgi:hypothetical protein
MQDNKKIIDGYRILSSSLTRLDIFRIEKQAKEANSISQYLTSWEIASSSIQKKRERKNMVENLRAINSL